MGSTTKPGDAQALGVAERRRSWLAAAGLYLVCELSPGGRSLEDVLRPALQNGVGVVQLRDKEASQSKLVKAAHAFRRLCDAYDALFIINDRPDLALACGADGVHLGQSDLPIATARRIVGDDLLIGLSTHTEAQIETATAGEACDYIAVGPVFETPTKPDYTPVGLALVGYAADRVEMPHFAIGGIDTENVGDVISAGAERLAIVRAITEAENPGAAAKKLSRALEIVRSE